MNLATTQLRDLTDRLLANGAGASEDVRFATAVRFCRQLSNVLSKLTGTAGSLSLLSRALVLSRQEAPCLKSVQVMPDGQLEGFTESAPEDEQAEWDEAGIVLVAQLLGLLHAFIGERLTTHLVDESWPTTPLNTQVDRNTEP